MGPLSLGELAAMSIDLTAQMLTPSLRRVYTSRAFLIAISASGAWRLPTCLCASPCWLRMKISQSGHSLIVRSSITAHYASGRFPRPGRALLRVRHCRVAHPCAVLPCLDAGTQPVAVARPVALDHVLEFVPVDGAEIVMAAFFVPLQQGIRHRDTEIIRLRHRLID